MFLTPAMPLEREIAFFNSHLGEWIQYYEGQYALVKGETLIGTFTKQEEAYEEGLKHFGEEPFLIRQVLKDVPPEQMPAFFLGLSNARIS